MYPSLPAIAPRVPQHHEPPGQEATRPACGGGSPAGGVCRGYRSGLALDGIIPYVLRWAPPPSAWASSRHFDRCLPDGEGGRGATAMHLVKACCGAAAARTEPLTVEATPRQTLPFLLTPTFHPSPLPSPPLPSPLPSPRSWPPPRSSSSWTPAHTTPQTCPYTRWVWVGCIGRWKEGLQLCVVVAECSRERARRGFACGHATVTRGRDAHMRRPFLAAAVRS